MSLKRKSAPEMESFLSGVKVLLIDIEGTMTPLSFTKVRTQQILEIYFFLYQNFH